MRMRLVGAVIGTLTLAGAAAMYALPRAAEIPSHAAPETTAASADPRIAELSKQIEELRRNLALESRQAHRRDEPIAGGTPTAEPDVEEQRAQEAEQRRQYMAGVAQAFAAEKVDPPWATRVAQRIQSAVEGDEYLRDRVHDVDCRRQTCRMRIDEDEIGKISTRMPLVTLALVDVLPSMTAEHTEEGGRRTMTVYLSSQSASPPSPKR